MMNENEFKELEELAKPLVEYLRKKHNPHTSIIISYDQAKAVQDLFGVPLSV